MHLRNGDAALAAAIARRGLKELAGDALRGGALLTRLVEAEIALGDLDAAAASASSLSALATAAESVPIAAQAGLCHGRVAMARGDHAGAVAELEAVCALLSSGTWPLLMGTARTELAEALAAQGDTPAAIGEARAAAAIFERLGARAGTDRVAALLRSLGATAPARSRDGQDRAVRIAQRPGGGSALADPGRPHERRDREAPLHLPKDRGTPREQGSLQARRAHESRSGRPRRRSPVLPLTLILEPQ